MIKAGIIGGTGYTGGELIRLLLNHPNAELSFVTSYSNVGKKVTDLHQDLIGEIDLEFIDNSTDADVLFLALPHKESKIWLENNNVGNAVVIDLGNDFRIGETYQGNSFVYGLPELNREKIKECSLIANPGCYPTTIELGLMPLLKNSLIKLDGIICDSKSGTTGAGRGLTLSTHFPEENETFAPYKVGAHRHTPEIEETLTNMANDKVNVTFTPHLLPINRGILSTIYCSPKNKINIEEIHKLYVESYKNEPFVNILPLGETASIKNVRLTNDCFISLHSNHRQDQIIVVSTIDNMIKRAAGQAIQNMNIILGFDETDGLNLIAPSF